MSSRTAGPRPRHCLKGLEALPTLSVTYRGATLREFDLDAALARQPAVILVDELAHTNAPGMRHPKRWQDVEELLAAGIDVWTTLNVQHIESLNDVIAQITGVAVKETLPDTVLERADEIELIDITPDKLMERLAAGKVYIPAQAERALKNFFQKGNLVALRELSLRQAASRVQRDVEYARQERAAAAPWLTTERLLVCVGPSPTNARIVRATKRLARSLGAEWLAVAVDTGAEGRHSASVQRTYGAKPATGRAAWRGDANACRPQRGRCAARFRPRAQRHEDRRRQNGPAALEAVGSPARSSISCWTKAAISMSTSCRAKARRRPSAHVLRRAKRTFAGATMRRPRRSSACAALSAWGARSAGLADANIVMIFLAGVAFVAARLGRGPSIAAAVASVLVFDFFFVPPRLTFAVSDTEYLITFAVMLGIGLLISELTTPTAGTACRLATAGTAHGAAVSA